MGTRTKTNTRPLIVTVFGTRPQYIKLAVLWRELETAFRSVLIDSGQHYDWDMSGALQQDTGLRPPDVHLGVGSAAAGIQIGRVAERLDRHLSRLKPQTVIVIGDTSTTAGGAVAAAYRGIPVAHIEAGLRSFDRTAPEEKNRIIADHLSTWRLCPTASAMRNLRKEGVRGGVHGVGDLMYEHWLEQHPRSRSVSLPPGFHFGEYYYLTAHRAENVDHPARLGQLIRILETLDLPVIYPVHPRTRRNLTRLGLWGKLRRQSRLCLLPPVNYSTSLALIAGAKAVLTDSGGVQREAYWSGVPCLVLRGVTEWPELLASKAGLVGLDLARVKSALHRPRRKGDARDSVFKKRHPARAIIRRLALDLRSA